MIQGRKVIGIVGGVGPYAGLDLNRKIWEENGVRNDPEHIPVVLASYPHLIPDRTEFLTGAVAENPGKGIAKAADFLWKAGSDWFAVPCNTAHHPVILKAMEEEMGKSGNPIQFVSLVDVVLDFLKGNFPLATQIGVMSTTGTWKTGLYEKALIQNGFRPLVANEPRQSRVHDAIYHPRFGIKSNQGAITPEAEEILEGELKMLIDSGAQAILLACTELPLWKSDHLTVMLVDPTRLLARVLVCMATGEIRM